jgi:hypothetical protein
MTISGIDSSHPSQDAATMPTRQKKNSHKIGTRRQRRRFGNGSLSVGRVI